VDTTPLWAEHEANTDRVVRRAIGMKHVEGGWPENVDGTEADQVDRYLKRANKDAKFKATAVALGAVVEAAVRQNNCVDIYQPYFEGATLDLASEPPSARGTAVFRDPAPVKRSVTAVSWHPEGTRIAVAYAVLRFQDERMTAARLPPASYIWDTSNPNAPIIELSPPSPLVSVRFNAKTPDILCGGSYNGLVHTFDVKKPRGVVVTSSSIDRSHYDPVYDTFWIQSKTNNQFVSVSTDGRLLFWDTRKLSEPTDEVALSDGTGRVLGGCSLEYNIEAGPTKFVIGTEQGIVLSANTKKKGGAGKGDAGLCTAMDMGPGRHHGPITAVQRNPAHPVYFLTVGDWCVKFWSEKNKTPIFQTPYSKVAYTGGAWSPTRAGVFFVLRADGVLEVWDFYDRVSGPVYTHKVSDVGLTSVAVHGSMQGGGGKLVAVGDAAGSVTMLEFSDNLALNQPNEKVIIGNFFDRESKREETLEKRALALARAQKANKGAAAGADAGGAPAAVGAPGEELAPEAQAVLDKIDADFRGMILGGEPEGKEGGAAEGKAAPAPEAAAEGGH